MWCFLRSNMFTLQTGGYDQIIQIWLMCFQLKVKPSPKRSWLIKFFETPKQLQLNSIAQKNCHHFDVQLLGIFVFLIKEWRYRSCWTLCEASGGIWIWIHAEIESWVFVRWQRFPFFVGMIPTVSLFLVNSLLKVYLEIFGLALGAGPLVYISWVISEVGNLILGLRAWGKVSGLWTWGPYEWWKDNRS